MSSSATLRVSPSPSRQANSLVHAYEALLEAKAMLRGEQSPFPAARDTNVSPPGPSPSPPQTGGTVSPSSSLDNAHTTAGIAAVVGAACYVAARHDNDVHAVRRVSNEGSTDGAVPPSRNHGGGQTEGGSTSDVPQRPSTAYQVSSGVVQMDRESEKSPSPEVQPPVTTPAHGLAVDGVRLARQAQHVRFSVPPPAGASRSPTTRTTPSLSPLPVPPSLHSFGGAHVPPRYVSEVDVRTVQLLQCLSYDEVEHIRFSLAQSEGLMLPSDEWSSPAMAVARGEQADTAKSAAAGASTMSSGPLRPTALAWDAAAPVLLDVSAQLQYAQHFYAQFIEGQSHEAPEEDGWTPGQNSRESVASASSLHSVSAGARKQADNYVDAAATAAKVAGSHSVAMGDDEDELTLSPISRSSLSDSPAQHAPDVYTTDAEDFARGAASRHSYKPPATAGPSILISPQKQHRTSPTLRPQIVLADPEEQRQVFRAHGAPQQPLRRSRRETSPHSSPIASLVELSRSPSTRPSRNASPSAAPSSTPWSLADFDVGRRLGCGHAGQTYLAREKRSRVTVALKRIPKASCGGCCVGGGDAHALDDEGSNEEAEKVSRSVTRAARLHMWAGRRCPHISKLYTFFEDAQHVYLTQEYAEDGDLASYAARQLHARLPEATVQRVVLQLACALAFLHANQIVHGAVAPRHVLLKEGATVAKLSGFTHATRLRAPQVAGNVLSSTETVEYAAPEVVCGHARSSKSDMWALGVLTYEALCGYLPFEHVSLTQVKHRICIGVVHYPSWMSATAKSFVASLLCVEEACRCSATEALEHPFLSRQKKSVNVPDLKANSNTVQQPASTAATAATVVLPGEQGKDEKPRSPSGAVSLPISRDLAFAFSQVEDESHVTSAPSPFGAVSTTSFLPLAGLTSAVDSLTMSSSTSSPSRRGGESGGASVVSGDNESGSASVSSMSAVPTAATTATSAGTNGNSASPFTFSNFALPSHSWRSSTQPYGTAGSHGESKRNHHGCGHNGLPSVVLTSPPSASSLVAGEETGVRLQRRSSATSMKSAALTATLSDVSASLLSTTCAPTGAAAPLVGLDGPSSSSKSSSHHPSGSGGGGPHPRPVTVTASSSFSLADHESRMPCSVTVSSLTAASPRPPSDGASALDVEVSPSSIASSSPAGHNSPPAHFTRHATQSLRQPAEMGTSEVPQVRPTAAALDLLRQPRTLSFLTAVPDERTAVTSCERAVVGKRVRTTIKKKVFNGPECAMRLDFDSLSDDEW